MIGVTDACRNSNPETSGRPVFRVHNYHRRVRRAARVRDVKPSTASLHIVDGNFAYVLGWSLADGIYPVITLFALRLAATRIPRLAVT